MNLKRKVVWIVVLYLHRTYWMGIDTWHRNRQVHKACIGQSVVDDKYVMLCDNVTDNTTQRQLKHTTTTKADGGEGGEAPYHSLISFQTTAEPGVNCTKILPCKWVLFVHCYVLATSNVLSGFLFLFVCCLRPSNI